MTTKKVRVTFQLPVALKQKMDAHETDWSAVAEQAIESHLALSSTSPSGAVETRLLERLRQSRDEYEATLFAEGQEVGRQWVRNGDYAQLRRFERLWDETQDQSTLWQTAEGDAYAASQHFFFAIEPSLRGEWREAQAFWEQLLGDDCEQNNEQEFLRGFVTAAIEMWEELQSDL
jgi:hypothetical protein